MANKSCGDCHCGKSHEKEENKVEDRNDEKKDEFKIEEECPSDTERQGRASKCDGCPGQSACQSMNPASDPDLAQIHLRMKAIKHKILVVSGKGGVGKSSMATQIALGLSQRGKKVGILDVDICGPSVPRILNVEGREIINANYGWVPVKHEKHDLSIMSVAFMISERDKAVIFRGPKKTNLIKQFLKNTYWGKLDYLIIDTPPGTSDEHLSVVSALKKANPDGALIVTTPQEVSLSTIRKEITFCKKMGLPIVGIVENMSGFVCPCCNEPTDIFMNGGGEKLSNEYQIPFLGRIPLDPNVTSTIDKGESIFTEHPESPAVKSIMSLVDGLIKD